MLISDFWLCGDNEAERIILPVPKIASIASSVFYWQRTTNRGKELGFMSFKSFIKDVFVGIIANLATTLILGVGMALVPIIGVETLLLALLIATLLNLAKRWNDVHHVLFRWWYWFSECHFALEIHPQNRIRTSEEYHPKAISKSFSSRIISHFICDDVKLNSLEFSCQDDAFLTCTTTNRVGLQEEHKGRYIQFSNGAINRMDRVVEFPFNKCVNYSFSTEMEYDSNTAPEYYIDIKRPVKLLTLSVKVFGDVQINNVKSKIIPLFGEFNANSKRARGIMVECESRPEYRVYNVRIKRPRLFHRYSITWKWMG